MVKKIRKKSKKNNSKSKLDSLQKELNSLPDSCSFCSRDFNLLEDADTWMVSVGSNQTPVLICPQCFKENDK